MNEAEFGRVPLTIVELEQPRCALRFGTGLCAATGTKCYNTLGTCGDLDNYDGAGSIRWRFVDDRPHAFDIADYSDPDNPETQAFPCLVKASTTSSKLNIGSSVSGSSPLGVTATATVVLQDFPYNDAVGDFYVADRAGYASGKPAPVRAGFWALWLARNKLFNGMNLRIYDGYEGQDISEMRVRLYTLDSVDGVSSDGKVTLKGLDPLRLAGDKKAMFPPVSDLEFFGGFSAAETGLRVIGSEDDLTSDLGNTGSKRYINIGREIISYTGYTDDGESVYTLTGVQRGALDTIPESIEDNDKAQRCGRYERLQFWNILHDLLANHTEIPDGLIDLAAWDLEGGTYLPTYASTRTVVKPTPIRQLAGEISQQGLFYIWWSEHDQLIKLLVVRPPSEAPVVINEDKNILDGAKLTRDPSSRLTRVSVFYNILDEFEGVKDDANYQNRFVVVDADNQGDERTQVIYAPWIVNRTQASQLATALLLRYRDVPEFLSITIDAKDRESLEIGAVSDVTTSEIVDTEGNAKERRWQVISAKEMEAGHTYVLNLQTYEYFGRFGRYMADGSPDYTSASEHERETGAFYADDSGLLSDLSEGYKYQ